MGVEKEKKVGIIDGVFDLLHIGHLKYFQKCKEYCDFLIVGVLSGARAQPEKRGGALSFLTDQEALKKLSLRIWLLA